MLQRTEGGVIAQSDGLWVKRHFMHHQVQWWSLWMANGGFNHHRLIFINPNHLINHVIILFKNIIFSNNWGDVATQYLMGAILTHSTHTKMEITSSFIYQYLYFELPVFAPHWRTILTKYKFKLCSFVMCK